MPASRPDAIIAAVGAVALVLAAAAGFAFMPTTVDADVRRTVAVRAVQWGLPSLGAALLAPLARAGDPAAQNNLAVLLVRGVGTARDPVRAAQLFNQAADAGLARAQLNLTLIRTPCSTQHGVATTARLEALARAGDSRAASLAADCLGGLFSDLPYAEGVRRLIAAAAIATASGDPDEELKFGWLLMLRSQGAQGWGLDHVRRETAQAAATYLLRAADHGRPAAYEGLSRLRRQFPEAAMDQVAARTPDEWVELAARAGHPKSRCIVGVRLATEMSRRPGSTTAAERQRFHEYFDTCLRNRNPRQVIFRDGRERTLGHDPLFDVWMREDPFLLTSPRYENYDHDIAGRDQALAQMTRLMEPGR